MNKFTLTGMIKRFPGKGGWHYVPLPDEDTDEFREMIRNLWPALLRATFTVNKTAWESSIMSIKDGPLFIALPKKVRQAEAIEEGDKVKIEYTLND